MPEAERRPLDIRLDATDEELATLRGALLGARAAELAEVRRRGGRLSYGYGTDSARESMGAEADQARLRMELLDRLIAALGEARERA
jgi:hypothetical protein